MISKKTKGYFSNCDFSGKRFSKNAFTLSLSLSVAYSESFMQKKVGLHFSTSHNGFLYGYGT